MDYLLIGRVIRNVSFLMGLNFIIDETTTDSKKESGNNVGKTTVLRLIDFCLDGDGKNLGSGLIKIHPMPMAAIQIADKKVCAQRS